LRRGVLTVEAQIEHGDARPRGGLRGERGAREHAGQVQDGTRTHAGVLTLGIMNRTAGRS